MCVYKLLRWRPGLHHTIGCAELAKTQWVTFLDIIYVIYNSLYSDLWHCVHPQRWPTRQKASDPQCHASINACVQHSMLAWLKSQMCRPFCPSLNTLNVFPTNVRKTNLNRFLIKNHGHIPWVTWYCSTGNKHHFMEQPERDYIYVLINKNPYLNSGL